MTDQPPLDDVMRQLAEVVATVIAKTEELGTADAPEQLVTPLGIRCLARSYIELRQHVRALYDLVQMGEGAASMRALLTKVGLTNPAAIPTGLFKVIDTVVTPSWPRVVPDVTALTADQLATIYCNVCGLIDFAKHETFIVRIWDGMDGCWTDVTSDIPRDEALRVWADRTKSGTRNCNYADIDYYAIFPSGTHMVWDGSEGREMHR